MLEITTTIEQDKLDKIISALEMIGGNKLPNTANAVQASTLMTQQAWVDKTKSVFDRPTGTYAKGIQQGLIYPNNDDPYSGSIINSAPHASYIEEGTQPHDMKRALFTSPKVKISKKGKRYLIIPFRHGTPSAGSHEGGVGANRAMLQTMPKSIYAQAKAMALGQQLRGTKDYGRRTQIAQRNPKDLSQLQIRKNPYTWKSGQYEGMTKVRSHPTAGGHHYMTFRIMHEDSQGWWHPGTPPLKLAENTAKEMEAPITRMIEQGVESDMKMLGLKR